MAFQAEAPARPPIIMAATEAETLSALALGAERTFPLAAGLLLEEIERAEIRPDKTMPDEVARMWSIVQFSDETGATLRTVLLVYPGEADIAAGKVSVLTPIGAGLIGLSPGQAILWPDRDGRERTLRILKVRPPGRLALG